VATFHHTSRRSDELPKSPFQTFVDVLREELRKNRELQENVKQLQGDVDKLQDSEAMRKARAAYERARVRVHFPLHARICAKFGYLLYSSPRA
jgi:import inner membrane translocase subunit TIM44